jgi:hypothetical protein
VYITHNLSVILKHMPQSESLRIIFTGVNRASSRPVRVNVDDSGCYLVTSVVLGEQRFKYNLPKLEVRFYPKIPASENLD